MGGWGDGGDEGDAQSGTSAGGSWRQCGREGRDCDAPSRALWPHPFGPHAGGSPRPADWLTRAIRPTRRIRRNPRRPHAIHAPPDAPPDATPDCPRHPHPHAIHTRHPWASSRAVHGPRRHLLDLRASHLLLHPLRQQQLARRRLDVRNTLLSEGRHVEDSSAGGLELIELQLLVGGQVVLGASCAREPDTHDTS